MSIEEMFSILFGLFIGYWVVSNLMNFKAPLKSEESKERHSHTQTSRDDTQGHQSWHDILKVSPSASLDEIRAAYKAQIRQYHPDTVSTLGEELKELAEKKSKAINAAYQEAIRLKG